MDYARRGLPDRPKVFPRARRRSSPVGVEPNSLNINGVGATQAGEPAPGGARRGADSGDRARRRRRPPDMADHRGEIYDGDKLLYVVACAPRKVALRGVVGTLMSNLGFETPSSVLARPFTRWW